MSFGIESKKLKRLVGYYSPFNSGQQLKYLSIFNGQAGLLRCTQSFDIDLQSSPFQGIDETSVQERIGWFGSNDEVKGSRGRSIFQVILRPCQYFGIKVYIGFSILSLLVVFVKIDHQLPYAWFGDVCNIFLLVLGYVLMLIPEIYQYLDNKVLRGYGFEGGIACIWRDGERKVIEYDGVVVGDVLEIKKGDIVGVDGLIIQNSVSVKEMFNNKQLILDKKRAKQCIKQWAESQQMYANYCIQDEEVMLPSPIILAGSEVVSGQGRMVVLCVGRCTRIGNFVYEVHRAAVQRRCKMERMFEHVSFEISKGLMVAVIVLSLIYWCKSIVFLIIEKQFLKADWTEYWLNFVTGLTIILFGLPLFQVFGLALGLSYLKLLIYRSDRIWYKYAKDSGSIKQLGSVLFEKVQEMRMINLKMWWNMGRQIIDDKYINSVNINDRFESMFIKSLQCRDFDPYEVGFKFSSFFVGSSQRSVESLEHALKQFAHMRSTINKNQHRDKNSNRSKHGTIQIRESEESFHIGGDRQVQIIYLKGNAETMLQQCTHILHKQTGQVIPLTKQLSEEILQLIKNMNTQQEPSLLTGYIQVHPNHPKFRQPGYRVVMLSVIGYQENYQNEEFQALHRMRKAGISFTLLGNQNHEEMVALAQEIGVAVQDKISIRLRGYDFNKLIGGLICKSCKKSLCICLREEQYIPILSNQQQFNRICKHLNVISQASPIQKMTLAIGFASAQQDTCFFGSTINDIPAMRASVLCATVRNQMYDSYVLAGTEVVLPNSNINTLQKLLGWSRVYYQFWQKYLTFSLVPGLVAFCVSFVSFVLFDNYCLTLVQVIWVQVVICPLLGITFILGRRGDDGEEGRKKDGVLLDRICLRHIYSQVMVQVGIILIVLFFGVSFIPESVDDIDIMIHDNWNAKYETQNRNTISSGIYRNIFNGNSIVGSIKDYGFYSRHFTFIFNLFVMMQFINYINCGNLGQKGFSLFSILNIWTILCIGCTIGLHLLVLFYGREVVQVYPGGLTFKQWAICLGLSLVVVLVAILTREMPFDDEGEENRGKVWPNRSFNLAVIAMVSRDTLQDFENDEEFDMRKIESLKQ